MGVLMTIKFETFEQFLERFPLDEFTIPVAYEPAEDSMDDHFIQIAQPITGVITDCLIRSANKRSIKKYRTEALAIISGALQITEV
jgi:hypothetical protein